MAHTPGYTTAVDTTAVSVPVSSVARVGALVLGLFVLAGGMLLSVGAVLLAPAGMWIAAFAQRRRGRVLARGTSWMVAAGVTAAGLALFAALLVAMAPAGTWRQTRAAMDSASAASAAAPPPAWLQRIAPEAARRPAAPRRIASPGLQMGMTIWGAGFGVILLGAVYGSIGWAAGMLLGFAGTGRWVGARPPGAAAEA